MPFIPHTESDVAAMLERIGVTDVGELFDEIPADLRIEGLGSIGPEISWSPDIIAALANLGLSLVLLWCSKIPLLFALRRLRPVALFLAVVFVVFALSPAGTLRGLLIVIRATAMVLLVFPLLGTTRFEVMMQALSSLRVPGPVVQVILFTYRYFFVHADQLRRMRIAMRARGFELRFRTWTPKILGHALGVVLVGSVERTERIYGAMVCRGFSGTFRSRTNFQTKLTDVLFCCCMLAAEGAVVVWRLV